MDKVSSLRKKHPLFLYENFRYEKKNNSLIIYFLFKIPPDIEFNPRIKIENINNKEFLQLDSKVLDNFIFNLGLVEMISYWKASCSPKIEIKAGSLSNKQKIWWESLFIKGLGEFFFKNKINFKIDKFLEIESTTHKKFSKDISYHQNLFLVLNGGGRDSAVTLEIVKELKRECTILMLNPTPASRELATLSQARNTIVVRREIDSQLLQLNSKGYLNGHTPFSAYLAFLSLLSALIFDHKYIIVSNERSAQEANIEFLGEKINHQYSKSFEFEKAFREYVSANLSKNIEYLSLLRPLHELQISKIFSNYPKYFGAFKSCNRAQKDNRWCGECAKCLSIYITLYPFIDRVNLIKIFRKDLYAEEKLQDLLLHLTGVKKPKPFECVGTYEELLEGLRLSIRKLEENNKSLPILLKFAKENILNSNSPHDKIMTSWNQTNFLPYDLEESLKAKIADEN